MASTRASPNWMLGIFGAPSFMGRSDGAFKHDLIVVERIEWYNRKKTAQNTNAQLQRRLEAVATKASQKKYAIKNNGVKNIFLLPKHDP